MERAAAAATPWPRWAEDVIVLSSGRPAEGTDPRPEKLYYKTKLCDKYEASGFCTYDDGCTYAHGRAELRPPVPPLPASPSHGFGSSVAWRSRPGGAEHVHQHHGGGGRGCGGGYGGGRVCHNFRDRGSCHFGDSCAFPHAASPAPPPGAAMRGPGEQKLAAGEARRSATPPLRPARHAGPAGRAFPPVPSAAATACDRLRQTPPQEDGGGGKASVLALLGLRKRNGIYGDWPEQYQH